MNATITPAEKRKITLFFKNRHIPSGLGTAEEACSIAGINLALSGRLTDTIPDCMSPVIGRWIIRIQDAMPDDLRNSPEWRRLLPHAAGTGRALEAERSAIILDWMWSTVLPQLQPIAARRGFGAEWKAMTEARTHDAAIVAKVAARNAVAVDAAIDAAAAYAAAGDADAAYTAAGAAAHAAGAAAHAAGAHAVDAAPRDYWAAVAPAALLKKLVEVSA